MASGKSSDTQGDSTQEAVQTLMDKIGQLTVAIAEFHRRLDDGNRAALNLANSIVDLATAGLVTPFSGKAG